MIRRPSRCVKRFFSEKTRPRCSSRSNLVKGRPPHSPRTKCPSLQFPGLRRPLDQSLRPVIFAPESKLTLMLEADRFAWVDYFCNGSLYRIKIALAESDCLIPVQVM